MSEHRAMQLSRLAQRHDGTALATARQLDRCPMLPCRLCGDVFSVPPRYLIAFGKRSEGVRYRHLAGLVSLEPHLFEDLAAREAARAVLYGLKNAVALAAPAGWRTTVAGG